MCLYINTLVAITLPNLATLDSLSFRYSCYEKNCIFRFVLYESPMGFACQLKTLSIIRYPVVEVCTLSHTPLCFC